MADKLIEWRVRTAIAEQKRSGAGLSNLAVRVKNGHVTIYGMAAAGPLAAVAEQTARSIPGVNDVETQIVVMRSYSGI